MKYWLGKYIFILHLFIIFFPFNLLFSYVFFHYIEICRKLICEFKHIFVLPNNLITHKILTKADFGLNKLGTCLRPVTF